jgi:hypothetical protein
MKKFKLAVLAFAMLIGVAALTPSYSYASTADQIRGGVDVVGGKGEKALEVRFVDIVNIMLFVLGAIAVIMIVFGGIRYTTSGGDASKVKAAKDTILYSVVGLVVAILAFAIVKFVLTSFK